MTDCKCGELKEEINELFPQAQFKKGCNKRKDYERRLYRPEDEHNIYRPGADEHCKYITEIYPEIIEHYKKYKEQIDNKVAFYSYGNEKMTIYSVNYEGYKERKDWQVQLSDKTLKDESEILDLVKHYAKLAIKMDNDYVKLIYDQNSERLYEFDLPEIEKNLTEWYDNVKSYELLKPLYNYNTQDGENQCPKEYVLDRLTNEDRKKCNLEEQDKTHSFINLIFDKNGTTNNNRMVLLGDYHNLMKFKIFCPEKMIVLDFFQEGNTEFPKLKWDVIINKIFIWCSIHKHRNKLIFPIMLFEPDHKSIFNFITKDKEYLGFLRIPYYIEKSATQLINKKEKEKPTPSKYCIGGGDKDSPKRVLRMLDLFYFNRGRNKKELVTFRGNTIYKNLIDERFRVTYLELHMIYYYSKKIVIKVDNTVSLNKNDDISLKFPDNTIYKFGICDIKSDNILVLFFKISDQNKISKLEYQEDIKIIKNTQILPIKIETLYNLILKPWKVKPAFYKGLSIPIDTTNLLLFSRCFTKDELYLSLLF